MALRSKQGYLELHKGRGKWKSYLFKVTGSTYFHYFGDKKMTSPKDQLLLSQLKSVELSAHPPKGGGKFVFEVKAKGTHWIISAPSQEEMFQWMEAIQPNSTKTLKAPLARAESEPTMDSPIGTISPPPNTSTKTPLTTRNGSGTHHGPPSDTNLLTASYNPSSVGVATSPSHQTNQTTPTQSNRSPVIPRSYQSMAGYNSSCSHPSNSHTPSVAATMPISHTSATPTSSISPLANKERSETCPVNVNQSFPVEPYVEPSSLNMPSTTRGTQKQHTLRHKQASLPVTSISTTPSPPPQHHPQLVSTQESVGFDYEVMDSSKKSAANESPSSAVPSGNHYMILVPNSDKDAATLAPGYVVPQSHQNGTETPQNEPTADVATDAEVMSMLSQKFTPDQLQMLLEMLKKMKMKRSDDLEASLKQQDLGYLVQKSATTLTDKFLVTQEDDPDSYDKRPSWAKAVNEDELTSVSSTSQFNVETDAYNIPETNIINMQSIGHGQFGEVFKAEYLPDGDQRRSMPVAVKTTKKDCSEKEKEDLLREMAVMSCMVHPNIVQLYGVVTNNVPAPWIVLEYLPYGDLKKYLQKSDRKPAEVLVKYMVDVAMGMHYIADRGLVHRDLAARNVLVGEGELCKVADFGLLRELPEDESIYYSTHNVPCPIRWMSPESISRRKFSVASDVWSFGILMWEMFNPKKTPYENMDNLQVAMKVNEGYRLPTPRGCPAVVSRIMKSCWHADPFKRPSFMLIATLLTSKVSSCVNKPSNTSTAETNLYSN